VRTALQRDERLALDDAAAHGEVDERRVVWTLLDTGLSVSELAGLLRASFDWQSRPPEIVLEGRRVPMSERVARLHRAHFELHASFGMTPRTIQRVVKRVARRARVTTPITPRVLRETFALKAIAEDGWPMTKLYSVLGLQLRDRFAPPQVAGPAQYDFVAGRDVPHKPGRR
jgi:integrase/recombinase XerD